MRASTSCLALVLLLGAIGIVAGATQVRGQSLEPEPVESAKLWGDQLESCRKNLRSLEADFTQEVMHRLAGVGETLTGEMKLRRGGRIRLDYREPRRLVVVSDGTTVRSWDPAARVAFESPVRGSPLVRFLHVAFERLDEGRFSLRWIGGATAPGVEGLAVIELIASSSSPLAERIVLSLDDHCPSVRRISVVDRAGTMMRFTFNKMRSNTGIGAGWFDFKPPPGAQIVRP